MHIVHGTWIPHHPADFVQDGAFYLWVERDGPSRHSDGRHPRHLSGNPLETFLDQRLGVYVPSMHFTEHTFLLPSADGAPLPSFELLPYLDMETPERWELAPWSICCSPVEHVIGTLATIHWMASNAPDDFQLGSDLIFWHQYSQLLKGAISGDHYIPALKLRELAGNGRKKQTKFEIYPGWELISDAYSRAVERYAPSMPPICTAAIGDSDRSSLYDPESLLRHFSETLVQHVVVGTPLTAALEQRLDGSLLRDAFYPVPPIPGTNGALDTYREWAGWRNEITAAQLDAGFTLCFRLDEACADDIDNWQLRFVVASRRDPSLKLDLADYWSLDPREKATLASHFGDDFEKHLLLALGHAARIYPRIWDGLETDRPVGLSLDLDGAFLFLKEHAWVLEGAGFTVMVPSWWTPEGRRRARVRLKATSRAGGSAAARSYFSLDSVIDYRYELAVDGEPVTDTEWQQLVEAKAPLVRFRGQWMELDRDRMQQMLAFWQKRRQEQPEMTVMDLIKVATEGEDEMEWEYDEQLDEMLSRLRDKSRLDPIADPENFAGVLRDYQKHGVAWLRFLEQLGLNPCLADDMGLGKTVQVIAQLVAERTEYGEVGPTLLIAPTSVLGNWRKEIERFSPQLRSLVHQGPARLKDPSAFQTECGEVDVVITSFALARLDEKLLRGMEWWRVVVDEAQNIKNPQSAQARAIAKLSARHRLALTGTPVENRLRDLWSIFNFLNPGYLGKEAQFRKAFEIPIQRENDVVRSAALKRLVDPFILRRLKTDERIIKDLPEKIEQKVYCNLTPEQASLYEAVVKDVEDQLEESEGMQRRGLILATLTRLKQVCNHPAQFLQDGSDFSSERSHKLQRLIEMIEEALANEESVLVFTQFTEVGGALERLLKHSLRCSTYYLHGGTSAAKRDRMVAEFQDPESGPSVFILSVRAGGTGLTLTKANHVFHFDRWWNPSVEDQATDRAFRIGQRKNVFAHKFVSLGTVEERIDQMIEDKKHLAAIVGSDESWITELDNDAFKDLIALRRDVLAEVA